MKCFFKATLVFTGVNGNRYDKIQKVLVDFSIAFEHRTMFFSVNFPTINPR